MPPPVIAPVQCWLRHVRRTPAGDVGTLVGAATFTAGPEDELGGRQGWQSGQAVAVLSDTGELTVTLPNAAGDDGILHRRRFAYFTDPAYRAGEEWLELYREPRDLLAVCTPYRGRKTRTLVELAGYDVAGLLQRFTGSELDVWDAYAPRDVFEHYTRAPAFAVGEDFAGFTVPPWQGWTAAPAGGVTVGPHRGPRIVSPAGEQRWIVHAIADDAPGDSYVAEARTRISATPALTPGTPQPVAGFILPGLVIGVWLDGTIAVQAGSLTSVIVADKHLPGFASGTLAIKAVVRGDRVFVLFNGELKVQLRRAELVPIAGETFYLEARAAGVTLDVDSCYLEVLNPLALRGPDKGDLRLPGIPPAAGLRARYYNAAPIVANDAVPGVPDWTQRLARVAELDEEPITERLELTLNLPAAGAAIPGMPGAYFGRWTGAIYLDLEASDRRVRLAEANGFARLFIGRSHRYVDELVARWPGDEATTSLTTANLRAELGSEAGWFPFILEAFGRTNAAGWVLEDTAVDAAGNPIDDAGGGSEFDPGTGGGVVGEPEPPLPAAWRVVPTSRLSPIGVVDEHFRHESHRGVIDRLTETFGYQWRVEPRSLESGEFPGQIPPRIRAGRDTDRVIRDLDGVDVAADSDAGDAVDRLAADAAGIADPRGSGQLSAEVIDYANAKAHLGVHSAYESLADMSEAAGVETRLGSLLALRSSPNEQVGVRPADTGGELVDTFPLSGELARLRWRPGEGVRLELDDVDVRDRTPRQLTRVELDVRPGAIAPPRVGFRQRPRSPAAVLKRTLRAVYAMSRNYQGTITLIAGSLGSAVGNGGIPAGPTVASADTFTRLPLPTNLDNVARVWLAVYYLSAGTAEVQINGAATGIIVPTAAYYDVTAWIVRALGEGRAYAMLINGTAGQSAEYALVGRFRI